MLKQKFWLFFILYYIIFYCDNKVIWFDIIQYVNINHPSYYPTRW